MPPLARAVHEEVRKSRVIGREADDALAVERSEARDRLSREGRHDLRHPALEVFLCPGFERRRLGREHPTYDDAPLARLGDRGVESGQLEQRDDHVLQGFVQSPAEASGYGTGKPKRNDVSRPPSKR